MSLGGKCRWVAVVFAVLLCSFGCAARWAYHQGKREGQRGNWDAAVARLTKALKKDPENIAYRITLDNARAQASRFHISEAKKHLAADDLEKAAEEFEVATKYDPANKSAADDLAITRDRIRKREEEKERRAEYEATKAKAQAARASIPVLSPRSPVPITLKFTDTPLEKIIETLGKVGAVNILFDPEFKSPSKPSSVNLTGVTFQEALDQITFVNKLFYKVVDQNTLIIVADSPASRRRYDELLVRTYYLQNADVNETVNLVKSMTGIQKVGGSPSLGAITVVGTPDELAIAEKVIENVDKTRGEVMVEVEILEVNRTKIKQYGISLSNYQVSSTLSPTGADKEVDSGFTTARAHLLSSLNLSDFIVQIPSTLLVKLLENESNARILASPRLRAAEGKATSLRIGTEVAIPVTTFTMPQAGTANTYGPATSFNTRNVGVNLELTPKINPNGEITLEMAVESSSLGAAREVSSGLKIPDILTRNVKGILRVRDGERTLIGGLISSTATTNLGSTLPGLRSIPLVGGLFGSNSKQKDETEVLISLTPHIVRAPKITEDDLTSLSVGTRDVVRVPGARPLFGRPDASPTPAPALPTPTPAPVPTPAPTPIAKPSPTPAPTPTPAPAPSPIAPNPVPAAAEPAEAAPTAPPDRVPATGLAARFVPIELSLKIDETGSLALVVLNARELVTVEAVLSFESSVVELVSVGPGALLSMDGVQVTSERQVEPGRVRLRFGREKGMSGSGAVVALSVKATRAGLSPFNVDSLLIVSAEGPRSLSSVVPGRVAVTP